MLKSEGAASVAQLQWFAVRCLFHHAMLQTYEERITLWHAQHVDEAIGEAEREAGDYAAALTEVRYLGVAQAFCMFDEPASGTEVFSLMRDSTLDPEAYVARFYDTGSERQQRH